MSEDRPAEKHCAHYELDSVCCAFEAGKFEVPVRVGRYLKTAGLTIEDVAECIAGLSPQDFHKSQAHTGRLGIWLDIYKPHFRGRRMYVKSVKHEDGTRFVLLSFCVDGDPH